MSCRIPVKKHWKETFLRNSKNKDGIRRRSSTEHRERIPNWKAVSVSKDFDGSLSSIELSKIPARFFPLLQKLLNPFGKSSNWHVVKSSEYVTTKQARPQAIKTICKESPTASISTRPWTVIRYRYGNFWAAFKEDIIFKFTVQRFYQLLRSGAFFSKTKQTKQPTSNRVSLKEPCTVGTLIVWCVFGRRSAWLWLANAPLVHNAAHVRDMYRTAYPQLSSRTTLFIRISTTGQSRLLCWIFWIFEAEGRKLNLWSASVY